MPPSPGHTEYACQETAIADWGLKAPTFREAARAWATMRPLPPSLPTVPPHRYGVRNLATLRPVAPRFVVCQSLQSLMSSLDKPESRAPSGPPIGLRRWEGASPPASLFGLRSACIASWSLFLFPGVSHSLLYSTYCTYPPLPSPPPSWP